MLRYYLGPGYRYATQLGPSTDPRVMDWRDALARLRAATVRHDLEPLLATVPPEGRLVVVSPVFRDYHAWQARWTRAVLPVVAGLDEGGRRRPALPAGRALSSNEILLEAQLLETAPGRRLRPAG